MTTVSAPVQIAFRADASLEIGTGHVMRCLTLAKALQGQGAECLLLCRPHEGHLLDHITAQGVRVLALDAPVVRRSETREPAHAPWVGAGWAEDARETRDALAAQARGGRVDWLVVDHYGLDARWERALRPATARLMVIDDLADRLHDCDLLLDQNLGRVAADYAALIPAGAHTLLGPSYALLRPEFAALRAASLARRPAPQFRRVLVTMGGVDKDNATARVLEALDASPLGPDVAITVVMGATAPWLEVVRARAARMHRPTEVLVGVRDMARLMAESDLAIGAGGSTTWERCALGLPTITVVLAENQKGVADGLQAAGATITLYPDAGFGAGLDALLGDQNLPGILAAMGQAAARLTDGGGTRRVVQKMGGNDA